MISKQVKVKVGKATLLFYLLLAVLGGGCLTFSIIDSIDGDKLWSLFLLLMGVSDVGISVYYFLNRVEVLEDKEEDNDDRS